MESTVPLADTHDADTTAEHNWVRSLTDYFNMESNGSAIAAIVGGTAFVLAAPLALKVAGFTATGPTAGSLASAFQSSIGNVATGTIFAACQSAGFLGLSVTTKAGVGIVGALVGVGIYLLIGWLC